MCTLKYMYVYELCVAFLLKFNVSMRFTLFRVNSCKLLK